MTQQHPEQPGQPRYDQAGLHGQAPQYDQGQPGQPGQPQYGQPQYGQPQYDQAGPYGQGGQYPAPGTRYGTQPYGVGGQYGTVQEPAKFRTLLTLTLLSAALYVLSAIPGLFAVDEMLNVTLEDVGAQPGMTAQDLEMVSSIMSTAGLVGMLVALLVGIGLYALVYFNLRGVKNWARILGIVFAIIGMISVFTGIGCLFSGNPLIIVSGVLTLAYVVVNIVWLVVAFRRDVADWFRQGRPVTA